MEGVAEAPRPLSKTKDHLDQKLHTANLSCKTLLANAFEDKVLDHKDKKTKALLQLIDIIDKKDNPSKEEQDCYDAFKIIHGDAIDIADEDTARDFSNIGDNICRRIIGNVEFTCPALDDGKCPLRYNEHCEIRMKPVI